MKRVLTLSQAQALYLHRYTLEHRPQWALKPCNGKFYAPQYRSDAEWYANTVFPGEGDIGKREDHCYSTGATWPCGQWLDAPIGTSWRTECGHGRVAYRPDWSVAEPYVTYRDGTAGRHFANLEACAQLFASHGMYLNREGK